MDSIIALLEPETGISERMKLADAYILTGQYIKADQVLNAFRNQAELANFIRTREIEMELLQNPQGKMALLTDSAMLMEVEAIAADRLMEGHSAAQAMLYAVRGDMFPEARLIPQYSPAAMNKKEEESTGIAVEDDKKDQGIRIYPNPASDLVWVQYGSDFKDGLIEIYSIAGNRVESIQLSKDIDHFILDSKKLESGVYFIIISSEGSIVAKEKLILMPSR